MSLVLTQNPKTKMFFIYGTHHGQRIRRSTKTTSRALAEAKLTQVFKEIERRATLGDKATFTFADAVAFYVERKDPNRNLAKNIKKALDYFKTIPCIHINQAKMLQYESHRYKNKTVTNSTRISGCITPVMSVINFAADYDLTERVKYKKPPIIKVPVVAAPDSWIKQVLAQPKEPWLQCVILILTFHGVRPITLKHLLWKHVDFEENRLHLVHQKNNKMFSPKMHPHVLEVLKTLPPGQPDEMVFPVLDTHNPALRVNEYVESLCNRAKIPFYSTHKFGRHAFVHRNLRNGWTLAEVGKGGNWSSMGVVYERYGHMEQTHIDKLLIEAKLKE